MATRKKVKTRLSKKNVSVKSIAREYKLVWNKINNEALRYFKTILKIDTTNPPGNEMVAIKFLKSILDKEGIKSTTIQTAPGRGCLIASYRSRSNTKAPLILTSHVDVVPHDPAKWDLPAFAAKQKDGFIYGRGTIDMKNMTIYSLLTILLFKRLGLKLDREIIFCAVADEEAGSKYGMEFLVEERPQLFRGAEYALNEIGAFTLHHEGTRFYPIQTAEKGFLWLHVNLEGRPGHGSLPHNENPIVHLGRVLDKMYHRNREIKIDYSAGLFIDHIAATLGFPKSKVLKLVKTKTFGNFVLNKLIPAGEQRTYFNAILHDTFSPTIFNSGDKENVIPGSAQTVLDCRLLPGTDVDQFLVDLQREMQSHTELKVDFTIIRKGEAATWSFDTDLYRHLKSMVEQADPGSIVIPNLISGFTDSKFLARIGITCYGFTPIKLPEGLRFSELFHGHNERIPIDGFLWGLKLFFETVKEYVSGR